MIFSGKHMKDKNCASFAKKYPKKQKWLCVKIQLVKVTHIDNDSSGGLLYHFMNWRNVTNERDY